MPRIQPIDPDTCPTEAADLLEVVRQNLGIVPNIVGAMAQSVAAAKAYLGFSQALAGGTLPTRLREQIALVVGETNSCRYCVSAHTALAKQAGLAEQEALDARQARASNPKETAALGFAQRIVTDRGMVTDGDVERVREAGYTDGQIVELVAAVALNLFTNYFNHVAGTEVDFPAAPEIAAV